MKFEKSNVILMERLVGYGALLAVSVAPMAAMAQEAAGISEWFSNIGAETSIIVDILVIIIGAVGIATAGFGIISAITAKRNREPMQHQPWMIVGGVLAVLLIPLIAALGTSVSGEDQGEEDVEAFLSDE